ncbi:hypothetical protein [Acinetobacter sp. DSM 11652]|uniref:hypothetical protein n=1 Tax=Acinetobacter sp. DSM 11652 TaxID=346222 RepID=UPI0008BC380B|nr:hypothetical protein [Acinetobacter sp. DSM 11652]SEL53039.1 hypothetical protein SAMN05216500_10357 [Acinetobacter sp. DSM 11652]
MNTSLIEVKDQFEVKYAVIGTFNTSQHASNLSQINIKFITVDNENIRPSFDLNFHSLNTGKIYQLI